jgi:hypothetical protein
MANETEYTDPTPISDYPEDIEGMALQDSTDIRHKMYGKDVREALARWVDVGAGVLSSNKATADTQNERITTVENEQADIQTQFRQVIAGSTTDDEIINARSGAATLLDALKAIRLQSSQPSEKVATITVESATDYPHVRAEIWAYGAGIPQTTVDLAGGSSVYEVPARSVWLNSGLAELYVDMTAIKAIYANFSLDTPVVTTTDTGAWLTSGVYSLGFFLDNAKITRLDQIKGV